MGFFGTWVATALAVGVAIFIVPGVYAVGESYIAAGIFALFLALVNASIKPIAQALSLPFTVITLGFFYLVVNALMLDLASWLSLTFFGVGVQTDSLMSAILASIVISFATSIFTSIMGD